MKTTKTAVLGLLFALAAASCGEDDRPAVGAGAGFDPSPRGGSPAPPSAVSPVDAGTDGPDEVPEVIGPELCNGVEQRSPNVVRYETIFPPDPPQGGVIVPGRYVLKEVRETVAQTGEPEAPPERPTTGLERTTIHVTPRAFRIVEAKGTDDGVGGSFPDGDRARAATYVTKGLAVELSLVCPAAGLLSIPYTARDHMLVLFPTAARSETYRRTPAPKD